MKAFHTLVTGDSGGGKTTLLREMHAEYPGLSIYMNDSDDPAEGVAGVTVESPAELWAAASTRIDFRYDPDRVVEALTAARKVCNEYHAATGYPTQVLHDEAQEVFGEELPMSHPSKRMLHKDRDKALKYVLATQDPSDLQPNYSALKQVRYWVWVGSWNKFHEGFLRYFDIPKDDLPDAEHKWVMFDKKMNVIGRGETDPDYS